MIVELCFVDTRQFAFFAYFIIFGDKHYTVSLDSILFIDEQHTVAEVSRRREATTRNEMCNDDDDEVAGKSNREAVFDNKPRHFAHLQLCQIGELESSNSVPLVPAMSDDVSSFYVLVSLVTAHEPHVPHPYEMLMLQKTDTCTYTYLLIYTENSQINRVNMIYFSKLMKLKSLVFFSHN